MKPAQGKPPNAWTSTRHLMVKLSPPSGKLETAQKSQIYLKYKPEITTWVWLWWHDKIGTIPDNMFYLG